MTHYIQIQRVDYDDYPQGQPKNIGPFDSEGAAELYMKTSPKFIKVNTYGYEHWQLAGRGFGSRSTVYVYPIDQLFTSPEDYDKRGY